MEPENWSERAPPAPGSCSARGGCGLGVRTTVTGAGVSELGRVGGGRSVGMPLVICNPSMPACTCATEAVLVVAVVVIAVVEELGGREGVLGFEGTERGT